jgi:hypothetical protein
MRTDRLRRRQARCPFPPHGVTMPWEEEWARRRMAIALTGNPMAKRHLMSWESLPPCYRDGVRAGWLDYGLDLALSTPRYSADVIYSQGYQEGQEMRDQVERIRKGME